MKIERTNILGLVIVEPTVYKDGRGLFFESFNEQRFQRELEILGLDVPKSFVQDNHSCSHSGVLRGLHFQNSPSAQGKLVRVVSGSAYDVAVDLREHSSTYLKWFGVELNSNNNKMLWIPEGFAHGFLALEDDTQFLDKTTNYYDPQCEGSLLWNDPQISIKWPKLKSYNISQKDRAAPLVSEIKLPIFKPKI